MPEADLNLLRDAALASGDIARKFWKQNPDVTDKPDGAGPVTEADLAIDRMLHSELRSARPDYGWLSEETEDDQKRLNHDRVFIIDPIDGTRAFIQGDSSFSHSLAIAEKGEVIAAAVYLPIRDEMFLAHKNGIATLNGKPIQVTAAATQGAKVLGAKPNFAPDHWQDDQTPPIERHFRSSLAWRLCLVAQGRFDAMITIRPTWEWDVAAGSLIATLAGATVTDLAQGEARFNNAHPKLRGMLAAGPDLHSDLISRLKHTSIPA
ncbi:inositol monophosphatase family protein [Halocynthiibacter namhaensis]|uniref:inositol monophosphatase family protein n=1 Tax=Halocynthiibacter namhaensis TaxID=1290553 RepID=UPI0005793225|nr:3'(2'),5'-bisphosphate nucleotidase CysQ [Halocynthiibacter namhaensis]